jgi:hypothetical protein
VFNYPIGVYFLEAKRGIFQEQVVDPVSTYTFKAFYPGRQYTLQGWYQRWVALPGLKLLAPAVGILEIGVADNLDASDGTGHFEKKVYKDSSGSAKWDEDVGADSGTDSVVVPLAGSTVSMSLELVGTTSNKPTWTTFTLSYKKAAVPAGLGPSPMFAYQTGVDDSVVEVFEAVRVAYWLLRMS